MEIKGYLSGGAWYRDRFQVAETFSTAGVPALVSTEAEAGLDLATTTATADMIGITHDTATYVTAQQTDNADPARTVLVDVRPDAVIYARLSGAAASGTALTLYDVTTASTDGLAVTTGDDWSNPEFDDSMLWGYDGSNMGIARKITSTSSTAATVTVALPYDTIVGDNFLRAPFWPWDDQCFTVTLTTTLDQVRADLAAATSTAELLPIRVETNTIRNNGTLTSGVYLVCKHHWLNNLS
jgi:hypothetical protein